MDNIVVALISAAVSICIWILSIPFEPFKAKLTCAFKLKTEQRYEQKREIKRVISKYKMQLINAAESLNHRLFNIYENYKWLQIEERPYRHNHFLNTTEYRLLLFFSWIKKIENEMIYLDVTLAEKCDLEFVKFLKLFQMALCDAELIRKVDNRYDKSHQTDHFFRDRFDSLCSIIGVDKIPMGYYDFKQLDIPEDFDLHWFLDGISPEENRYRWDLLQILHYLIIMFLNTYGYDYQHTDISKENRLFARKNKLISGYRDELTRYNLIKQKEIKRFIRFCELNRLLPKIYPALPHLERDGFPWGKLSGLN